MRKIWNVLAGTGLSLCIIFQGTVGCLAVNTYDASVDSLEGKLLFPGDSIRTDGLVRISPDMTYADLAEGTWTNTDEVRSYRVSSYSEEETGETGLVVAPEGFVVNVKGGRSSSDDGLGDTHDPSATVWFPVDDEAALQQWTEDPANANVAEMVDKASYPEGTWVKITAAPAPAGRTFGHWESEPQVFLEDAGASETAFLMPGEALTIQAVFSEAEDPGEEAQDQEDNGMDAAEPDAAEPDAAEPDGEVDWMEEAAPEGEEGYQEPAEGAYEEAAQMEEAAPEGEEGYQEPAQEDYQEPAEQPYEEAAPEGGEDYQEPAQEDYQEPAQEDYQEPAQEDYQEPAQEDNAAPAPEGDASLVGDTFEVKVEGGEGSGSYYPGDEVKVSLLPEETRTFLYWETDLDTVWFADAYEAETTFPMPFEAVEVRAVFEEDEAAGLEEDDADAYDEADAEAEEANADEDAAADADDNEEAGAEDTAEEISVIPEEAGGQEVPADTTQEVPAEEVPAQADAVPADASQEAPAEEVPAQADAVPADASQEAPAEEIPAEAGAEEEVPAGEEEAAEEAAAAANDAAPVPAVEPAPVPAEEEAPVPAEQKVPFPAEEEDPAAAEDEEEDPAFEEEDDIYYHISIETNGVLLDGVDGQNGDNYAQEGDPVTITAPENGRYLRGWNILIEETGEAVDYDVDPEDPFTALFFMPEADIAVEAIYEDIPRNEVQVISGRGGAVYSQGDYVEITADPAPEGQRFKQWMLLAGNVQIEDLYQAQTGFVMGAVPVQVRAVYELIPYTLTVLNGNGGGIYHKGDTAQITANWPEDGKEFGAWTSSGVAVNGADRYYASLTMPSADVTVTATYVDGPSPTGNGINGLQQGGQYLKGSKLTFTAFGNGPDKSNPNPGDFKWVPVSYQIGTVSGGWSGSDYTTSMAISSSGSYTLLVTYVKQMFDGNTWTSTNVTDQKSITFDVVDALAVQTGDDTPIAIMVLAAAAALAVILGIAVRRRRAA